MADVQQQNEASEKRAFVWIDLTHDPSLSIAPAVSGAFEFRTVREPHHIAGLMGPCAPPFICVELEDGNDADARSFEMLAHVREVYADLPALIVAGRCSSILALWAVRLRVWDVIIKPVSVQKICSAIGALASKLHRRESDEAAHVLAARIGLQRLTMRTSPAIAYVAKHFAGKILLTDVAAQCRLSPSQFCRTFRKEHHVSFGRYLLRYRMERARERLGLPHVLVKEVAYEVGFNDLSHFTRSFRREFGVCPSAYQAEAMMRREAPVAA